VTHFAPGVPLDAPGCGGSKG